MKSLFSLSWVYSMNSDTAFNIGALGIALPILIMAVIGFFQIDSRTAIMSDNTCVVLMVVLMLFAAIWSDIWKGVEKKIKEKRK